MSKILFSEKQNTKPSWIWLLFILLFAIFAYTFVMQVIFNKPVGNQASSDLGLWLNGGLLLLVFLLIKNMVLRVEIREDGIYYQYSPIHWKWRMLPYSNIKTAYIRKYSALKEYGGYGVRLGFAGKGRALNVRGNIGLQLEFNDNKSKLLIGTQKPEELAEALKQKIALSSPSDNNIGNNNKEEINKSKEEDNSDK